MCEIINTCLRDGKFPDYSKIFESFLRTWIVEDIGNKIDKNQFAGKRGVGTEYMIVMIVDRVLRLLDTPGMSAVIMGAVDWMGPFDQTDPTKTVQKLVAMGVRSSLIPVIIEFLDSRMMSVKFNQEESTLYESIGGGPQGSWIGQNCYITASDDAAFWMDLED